MDYGSHSSFILNWEPPSFKKRNFNTRASVSTREDPFSRRISKILTWVPIFKGSQKLHEKQALTSSLSRMSPSSGRDMDHWFLHLSNMMVFMTVDSICWNRSECSSSRCRKVVCWLGEMATTESFLLVLLRFLKKKVTMWSSVPQQPVQTTESAGKLKIR